MDTALYAGCRPSHCPVTTSVLQTVPQTLKPSPFGNGKDGFTHTWQSDHYDIVLADMFPCVLQEQIPQQQIR